MQERAPGTDASLIVGYVAVIAILFVGFAGIHYVESRWSTLNEVRRHAEGMVTWLERSLLLSREALHVLADRPTETCEQAQLGGGVDALLPSVTVERIELGRGAQTLCSWLPDPAKRQLSKTHCAVSDAAGIHEMQLRVNGPGDRWAVARLDTACLVTPLVLSFQASEVSIRLASVAGRQAAGTDGDDGWFPSSDLYVSAEKEPLGFVVSVPEWMILKNWMRQLPVFAALFAGVGVIGWYGPVGALRRRASIEGQVASAIRKGDFFLVYLPTVNIETGEWTGVEALLRWRHPTRGVLQPASFIPWIERSPQIFETTRWVMRHAAQDIARFKQERAALDLSINVPPNQLADPRLVAIAEEAFGEQPQALKRVIIELTEREVADYSSEVVQDVVRRLKERGAQLALDDFGVGFSNFACLHVIDIDFIKVDKSFLQDNKGREGGPNAVASIVHLAREFGVTIIAEGVETERQLSRLRHYGIRIAQGFLFSRPLDAESVLTSLRAQKNAA